MVLFGQALYPDGCVPVAQAAWYRKHIATFCDVLAGIRRHLWGFWTFPTSSTDSSVVLVPRSTLERLSWAICYCVGNVQSRAQAEQAIGDDSPQLQAGGFLNDMAVSSHGDSSVQPHERAVARKQLMSRLARTDVWHVRAFTQANGLAWNLQTQFSCQCAKELLQYSFRQAKKRSVFLRLRAARLSSLGLKPRALRRDLVKRL